MMPNKSSFLGRVAIGGLFSLTGILQGCGFNLTGIEPKEGIYEANNSHGEVWEEIVREDAVYSTYGAIPLRGISFRSINSDVVGNGCRDCDCPREGLNLTGYFSDNENYEYSIMLLEYCSPYSVEKIHAKWIREIEN